MEDMKATVRLIEPEEQVEIDIEKINRGHRYREDMGDIDSLANDIRKVGLINPITVKKAHGGGYYLMAGDRRLAACKELGWKRIACNVYPEDLSQLERNLIELSENINRKDMEFAEEVALTKQIDLAMKELYGEKRHVGNSSMGHGLRDTAKILGKSVGTVSMDIQLARAIEAIPELADAKDKKEAMKMLRNMKRVYDVEKVSKAIKEKRATTPKEVAKKTLMECYMIGDSLKEMKKVGDGTVDMCEVDTPYAVGLHHTKKNAGMNIGTYNEWASDDYVHNIDAVLSECYRVLKDTGWLVWWFAFEPWFETVYQSIIKAGFLALRVPAIWAKSKGQANNPNLYLASTHEPFFYARKGMAEIQKQGRDNVFTFRGVTPTKKIHPTEKPIELLSDIYQTFISPGSRIMIPFLGSGNGILAAHNVECSAFGWDLSDEYRNDFIVRVNSNDGDIYSSY